jgi:cell wall-associated NlpC family hydrolase
MEDSTEDVLSPKLPLRGALMALEYGHLEGLEFNIETQNCYTILRAFYRDNYGIELTDYACPTDWWTKGLDLYHRLAEDEGFQIIMDHPRHWRPGDVILMAIESPTGNHCGILLPGGKMLHHLVGQRSLVTSFGGMFRNTRVATYRHKDVPTPVEELVDFATLSKVAS